MKKLQINRATRPGPDLASISAFPPLMVDSNSRNASNARPALESNRSATGCFQMFGNSANRSNGNASQQRNPYISSTNSQSQQSFSQGQLTQLSQNIQSSQNSQDETMPDQAWKFGSQEREMPFRSNSYLAASRSNGSRDDNSHSLIIARPSGGNNNLIQRTGHGSYGSERVSEELEQSLGRFDKSLNRLVLVLDSVQSDLLQVNRSLRNISLETEEIRQKLLAHENHLQLLLKEGECSKASIVESLKALPSQICNETKKLKLEELPESLWKLPGTINEQLSSMKAELRCALLDELKKIEQTLQPLEREPERPNQMKSSGPETCVVKHRKASTSSLVNSCGQDWEATTYSPLRQYQYRQYREERTRNSSLERVLRKPRECLVDAKGFRSITKKGRSCAQVWKTPVSSSNIVMEIEDDEDFGYLSRNEDSTRKTPKTSLCDEYCAGYGQESDEQEHEEDVQRILRRARRKRKMQRCI